MAGQRPESNYKEFATKDKRNALRRKDKCAVGGMECAGADLILTYFAKDAAKVLNK